MRRRPLGMVCLGIIFFLFLVTIRMPAFFTDYGGLEKKQVTVTGKVYQKESDGQKKKGGVLYLQLFTAKAEKKTIDVSGQRAVCYLKAGQTLPKAGSIITATGKLKSFQKASNPGQFDAESYYHILKISFQLTQTEIQKTSTEFETGKEWCFQRKEALCKALNDTLPKQEAAVMQTMLLGEKAALDKELKGLYQRNGIAHVLAISGLHISLIGMLVHRLLRKLGASVRASALFSAGLVFLYGMLTGFSVSSMRAVLMFLFHMTALLAGRTYDLITAALLTAVLLLLEQPLYLHHSGFLFSFGCVFAIGFLVPVMTYETRGQKRKEAGEEWRETKSPLLMLMERKLQSEKKKKERQNTLLKTLAGGTVITFSVLPVQLWYFYQTPVYAVFLNLLIIPLMSFLVPGGILLVGAEKLTCFLQGFQKLRHAAAVGALAEQGIAAFVIGVLDVYEKACRFCEALPVHLLTTGRPSVYQTVIFYLLLLFILFFQKKLSLLKKWMIFLTAALLLLLPAGKGKDGLSLTFLDVGQGDCIHIRDSNGAHYLVDGGSSSVSGVGTYRILPYLKYRGVKELEGIFITHPDEDHSNGIKELLIKGKEQGLRIKNVYLPAVGEESKTKEYLSLKETAKKAGIAVKEIGAGWQYTKGVESGDADGVSFLCLHPMYGYENKNANEYSLVLLVRYGAFSALLTGDVEGEGERLMTENLKKEGIERLTVLKAAHHGSANSTSEELLSLTKPCYAVISYGENNRYHHPHKETMERLLACGTQILETPISGAVTIKTDGKRMRTEEFCRTDKGYRKES